MVTRWAMMGSNVFESGASIVRVPLVLAPISLKLFVAGVPDEPENQTKAKGLVADPTSIAPAVPASNEVLIATEARFDNAVSAPPAPDDDSVVPVKVNPDPMVIS